MKQFFVVDQNKLRTRELEHLVDFSLDVNFILVDVAMLELCQNQEWDMTIRKSLSILAKHPSRVHAAWGVGEVFRFELAHKKSAEGKMLSHAHTLIIRDLLRDVARGEILETMANFSKNYSRISASLGEKELNHAGNKADLIDLMEPVKFALGKTGLNRLRNGHLSRMERLEIIRAVPELISEFFREIGWSNWEKKEFLRRKPLVLRQLYSTMWLCLNRLSHGGVEGARAEAVTNDLLDTEYVVIATFFDGLISGDRRVNESYIDLKELLSQPQIQSRRKQ